MQEASGSEAACNSSQVYAADSFPLDQHPQSYSIGLSGHGEARHENKGKLPIESTALLGVGEI